MLSSLFGSKSGGVQSVASVFCQLEGFSIISEALTPEGLVPLMDEYLTQVSDPITSAGGNRPPPFENKADAVLIMAKS